MRPMRWTRAGRVDRHQAKHQGYTRQHKLNEVEHLVRMSVADVCELGSILKCDADEKLALEKKVCELQKKCKIVEKNVS